MNKVRSCINCILTIIFAVFMMVNCDITHAAGVPKSVIEKAEKTVVTVLNYTPEGRATGSGVIYDGEKGYVLTNHHVIEDAQNNMVKIITSEGYHYNAKILGYDDVFDLAVLQIMNFREKFPEAKIVDKGWKLHDDVVAIGAAKSLAATVTQGIISSPRDRVCYVENYGYLGIQTDAAINSGNSGGGLFNAKGELIGINSASRLGELISEKAVSMSNNIGYAIDLNRYAIFIPFMEKGIKIKMLTEGMTGFGIGDSVDVNLEGYLKNKVLISRVYSLKPRYNGEYTNKYSGHLPRTGAWIIGVDPGIDDFEYTSNFISALDRMRFWYTLVGEVDIIYYAGKHEDIDLSDKTLLEEIDKRKVDEKDLGIVSIQDKKPLDEKTRLAIIDRLKELRLSK